LFNVDDINRLVTHSRVRPWWTTARPMLMASVLLGMVVVTLLPDREGWPRTVGMILPWVLLGLLFGYSWITNARQNRRARLLTHAVECVQQEKSDEAETALLGLLSSPMHDGYARIQALLALAAVTELQHNSLASQAAYESIVADETKMPWQGRLAAVGLAWSMLNNDQLADAVTLLDRLAAQDHPPSIAAYVELVALYREVLMGQSESACQSETTRRDLFRQHLSTRAAYGYGLLAAAWDLRGNAERAAACWRDATPLMTTAKLTDRFKLLQPIADRYPAVESPL